MKEAVIELINKQAEDEGLWFQAETASEAYLQQELRKLHAAIEETDQRKTLQRQLIKLGDMMGDGLHHESPWIAKEYRKVAKRLFPNMYSSKQKNL